MAFAAASAALVISMAAHAGDPPAAATPPCAAHGTAQGRPLASMKDLPPEVSSLVEHEIGRVADIAGRFNKTDVIDVDLPMQALTGGWVGARCIVAHFVRGGLAYQWFTLTFGKDEAGNWQRVSMQAERPGR